MIFTIGKTEYYERYFREQDCPRKLGKTNDYEGGSVWKTREEAQKFCPEGYSVYGVEADWGKDTEPNENGDYHNLLVTSPLVRLEATYGREV